MGEQLSLPLDGVDVVAPAQITPRLPTKEERQQRLFEDAKCFRIKSRIRAAVVRSQIVEAYSILEKIDFDGVSDTVFRDHITRAKRALESAVDDFLMDDHYHDERITAIKNMTQEEYFTEQSSIFPTTGAANG